MLYTCHLETGIPNGLPGKYSIHDFKHRVDYEASTTEIVSLKYHEMDTLGHTIAD